MNNPQIKIFIKNKGNLLANASVTIETLDFGKITIKGFQIWKNNTFNERLQDQIYIKPLSIRVYTHYVPQIFFENMDKWCEMEQLIYIAFNDKRNEESKEEVDINDIPENL